MSRLVSILAGLAAGIWLTIILGEPTVGAIIGSYVLLLFELPRNGAEKRRLRHVINGQYLRLKDSGIRIEKMNHQLRIQQHELALSLIHISEPTRPY